MSRRQGMAYVAALLLVAAGCEAGSFLMSWAGSGGKRTVVSGSINEVAARLQASLGKINVIVAVNPMDEDTIRLNGLTKSGQRFALVLKRQTTSHGENTILTVEWEKDADEEFWASVLELVVRPASPTGGASAPGGNSGH